MKIHFLNAKRTTLHSVEATYSISIDNIDNEKITVEWNNVHPGTGEICEYDLQIDTKSENKVLANRVDEAIREGETENNPDLDLYLALRDTFTGQDCKDCG
jgi:hypothetical protein